MVSFLLDNGLMTAFVGEKSDLGNDGQLNDSVVDKIIENNSQYSPNLVTKLVIGGAVSGIICKLPENLPEGIEVIEFSDACNLERLPQNLPNSLKDIIGLMPALNLSVQDAERIRDHIRRNNNEPTSLTEFIKMKIQHDIKEKLSKLKGTNYKNIKEFFEDYYVKYSQQVKESVEFNNLLDALIKKKDDPDFVNLINKITTYYIQECVNQRVVGIITLNAIVNAESAATISEKLNALAPLIAIQQAQIVDYEEREKDKLKETLESIQAKLNVKGIEQNTREELEQRKKDIMNKIEIFDKEREDGGYQRVKWYNSLLDAEMTNFFVRKFSNTHSEFCWTGIPSYIRFVGKKGNVRMNKVFERMEKATLDKISTPRLIYDNLPLAPMGNEALNFILGGKEKNDNGFKHLVTEHINQKLSMFTGDRNDESFESHFKNLKKILGEKQYSALKIHFMNPLTAGTFICGAETIKWEDFINMLNGSKDNILANKPARKDELIEIAGLLELLPVDCINQNQLQKLQNIISSDDLKDVSEITSEGYESIYESLQYCLYYLSPSLWEARVAATFNSEIENTLIRSEASISIDEIKSIEVIYNIFKSSLGTEREVNINYAGVDQLLEETKGSINLSEAVKILHIIVDTNENITPRDLIEKLSEYVVEQIKGGKPILTDANRVELIKQFLKSESISFPENFDQEQANELMELICAAAIEPSFEQTISDQLATDIFNFMRVVTNLACANGAQANHVTNVLNRQQNLKILQQVLADKGEWDQKHPKTDDGKPKDILNAEQMVEKAAGVLATFVTQAFNDRNPESEKINSFVQDLITLLGSHTKTVEAQAEPMSTKLLDKFKERLNSLCEVNPKSYVDKVTVEDPHPDPNNVNGNQSRTVKHQAGEERAA